MDRPNVNKRIFDNIKESALNSTVCTQTAKIWSLDTINLFRSDPTKFTSAQTLRSADTARAETCRLVLTKLLACLSISADLNNKII